MSSPCGLDRLLLSPWRVVTMARGTVMRHAAFPAVAARTSLFRGKQNIRGLAAMLGFVTGGASNFEMFAVIEARADQPPVRDGRFGHLRKFISWGRDLVAVSAAGNPRSAERASRANSRDGRGPGVTKKYSLFEFLARA